MTTFANVLRRQLRDPGRPLVTFYDESTGERVELSVATYANWVAKASGLLVEELGLERGQRLRVDLPPHWLGAVFLGAAWNSGLVITDATPDARPDAVVCGPGTLSRWAPLASATPVLACSLLPLGVCFRDPLPAGVHDVGVEVWGQPDSFVPWDPPGDDDPAVEQAGLVTSQGDWWAAAGGSGRADGSRLLSEADPASPPGAASFAEPLVVGGSLVLVTGADAARLDAIAEAERVTERWTPRS